MDPTKHAFLKAVDSATDIHLWMALGPDTGTYVRVARAELWQSICAELVRGKQPDGIQ